MVGSTPCIIGDGAASGVVGTTGLERVGGMGAWVVGSRVSPCVGQGVGSLRILGPDGDVCGVGSEVGLVGEMGGVAVTESTLDSGDCDERQQGGNINKLILLAVRTKVYPRRSRRE